MPARKEQIPCSFRPRCLTPMFSCRGLSLFKFVILNVRYLMLEHNPTISKVRPCLLQHVVRPLQRLLGGLRAYGLCTGPGQATSSSGD